MASVSLGDARELQATDGSADAVLLLGPLYHLTGRADRVTALREACRVLRPGGVVVAKALSRFYPVFEELASGMPPEPGWRDSLPQFLADGQYRNPGGDPGSFTTSYFHRPEELDGRNRGGRAGGARVPGDQRERQAPAGPVRAAG